MASLGGPLHYFSCLHWEKVFHNDQWTSGFTSLLLHLVVRPCSTVEGLVSSWQILEGSCCISHKLPLLLVLSAPAHQQVLSPHSACRPFAECAPISQCLSYAGPPELGVEARHGLTSAEKQEMITLVSRQYPYWYSPGGCWQTLLQAHDGPTGSCHQASVPVPPQGEGSSPGCSSPGGLPFPRLRFTSVFVEIHIAVVVLFFHLVWATRVAAPPSSYKVLSPFWCPLDEKELRPKERLCKFHWDKYAVERSCKMYTWAYKPHLMKNPWTSWEPSKQSFWWKALFSLLFSPCEQELKGKTISDIMLLMWKSNSVSTSGNSLSSLL